MMFKYLSCLQPLVGTQQEHRLNSDSDIHFFIGNSVAKPSAWDFAQKLSNCLATAQPQIGDFFFKTAYFC